MISYQREVSFQRSDVDIPSSTQSPVVEATKILMLKV